MTGYVIRYHHQGHPHLQPQPLQMTFFYRLRVRSHDHAKIAMNNEIYASNVCMNIYDVNVNDNLEM
jgi:hypothetical protein